jgi:outer membrane lipoprotein LolB
VYWQQGADDYQMRFNAPLGQGALLLKGNYHQVTLRTADNKVFQADNPDTLLTQVLKLELPVTGLHYWIRGLPAPISTPKRLNLNENGYLHSLYQDGWQIEYLSYFNESDPHLPKQIYLENHQFQVKMVISQWER